MHCGEWRDADTNNGIFQGAGEVQQPAGVFPGALTIPWIYSHCSCISVWFRSWLLPGDKDIRVAEDWRWGVALYKSGMDFIHTHHTVQMLLSSKSQRGRFPEARVQSFRSEPQFWWQTMCMTFQDTETQFQEHSQHVLPVPRNGENDSELRVVLPTTCLCFFLTQNTLRCSAWGSCCCCWSYTRQNSMK